MLRLPHKYTSSNSKGNTAKHGETRRNESPPGTQTTARTPKCCACHANTSSDSNGNTAKDESPLATQTPDRTPTCCACHANTSSDSNGNTAKHGETGEPATQTRARTPNVLGLPCKYQQRQQREHGEIRQQRGRLMCCACHTNIPAATATGTQRNTAKHESPPGTQTTARTPTCCACHANTSSDSNGNTAKHESPLATQTPSGTPKCDVEMIYG